MDVEGMGWDALVRKGERRDALGLMTLGLFIAGAGVGLLNVHFRREL